MQFIREHRSNSQGVSTKRMPGVARELFWSVLVVALAFLASHTLFQTAQVEGISMLPTLQNKELLLVDTVSYRLHAPHRGDIIILRPPVSQDNFVKRVIGIPGDTVHVVSGMVMINNKRLPEPYIRMPHTYNWGPRRVPTGTFFVLGDNRDASYDSHLWPSDEAFLQENKVIGRAVLSYWPPNEAHIFTTPSFDGIG